MTMDDQGIKIPLRIDTSQIESDLRAIDPDIKRLEAAFKKAFNAEGVVGNTKSAIFSPAKTTAEARAAIQSLPPATAAQVLPGAMQAQAALDARLKVLERHAARGSASLPPTAAQAAQQRLSAVNATMQAHTEQRRQTYMQARTAQPNAKPVQIEGTPSFISKLAAANAKASPALALYRAAGGRVPGGARMGGMLGSAADLAMTNPYAAGGALLAAATVGTAVYGNQVQTNFNRNQAALSSSLVGGPLLGNQRTTMGLKTSQISQDLSFDPKEVQGIVQALGQAGIRQGDMVNNLRNVIAMAGPNQLPTNDVTSVAAALGTAGGENNTQVNKTFQDMGNTAKDAHISLTELLASMKALSTGAINAAKDVGGLSAVQSIIGASSGINAGAFMAPVLGATGSQALQASALLGMTPQQLLRDQSGARGGTAQIYDRIAGLVKRVDHGPAGTDVAESLLSSSGLVDTSNIDPKRLSALIEGMRTAAPDQASKMAAQLYKTADTKTVSQDKSYKDAADAMQSLTTWGQRAAYMFENWSTQLVNSAPTPPPTKALPGMSLQATQEYARMDPAAYQAALHSGTAAGSSAPSGSLPGYSYGVGTEFARQQGIAVKNINGTMNYANPGIVADDLTAAKRNHVSAATLLAMQSQESSFQAGAISKDHGYGLAQFTDDKAARQYLHVKPGQDWHAAALDPKRASEGQAEYLAALLKQSGGNEVLALSRYNGGNKPGAKAQHYGSVVERNAQDVANRMDVHVDVTVHDQSGRTLPSTSRTVAGSKAYTPPPGLHHG